MFAEDLAVCLTSGHHRTAVEPGSMTTREGDEDAGATYLEGQPATGRLPECR